MFYCQNDDETLVMLTLAGEQSAYEALVVRYQKAVVASALSVTHNYYMAEDAAQDAFVSAWMKLNTLQDGAKFRSWVCRIAKNCALNMVMRFRSYMPLETVENLNIDDENTLNPAELYALSEERKDLHESIGKLPDKVKEIIHLHYFDGLSISEIADRMRISQGTVKWQLHDGRKRIRKELCAMNEKCDDTFVQRVMKKVEELKLWQFKNDKKGFEIVYRDVLRDVDNLPESQDKNHALADVLLRGWWWLPGEKNDALLKRIENSAVEGRNEEAMTFIVIHEDSRFWESARIEFMRDRQIPRLEKTGFKKTLGLEWFRLGYYYFQEGKAKEGKEAYDRAREILTPADYLYHMVPFALRIEEVLASEYKEKDRIHYKLRTCSHEYRYQDGALRFWDQDEATKGFLSSVDLEVGCIFRNSSLCDGRFFAEIGVGETYVGSDGTELLFASDGETVKTPAGSFENCQLWITTHTDITHKSVFKSYYKDGVGIVKHEHIADGVSDTRLLSSYHIAGGDGLLPMAEGNKWEYSAEYAADIIRAELVYEVVYSNLSGIADTGGSPDAEKGFHADKERILVMSWENIERLKYDENSWIDMVQQIANDYYSEDSDKVYDVSHVVERAEALAKTPVEKAHTKVAAAVVRRIMETDPVFNPDCTATGHWNFFNRRTLIKKNGNVSLSDYYARWEFELKRGINGETPILYNDIYGILQDATNCLWSDEWRIGSSPTVEYIQCNNVVQTKIACEDGGTVTTKAGVFDHCLRLVLDISGMTEGWFYRGGRKVYYFAEGIGIVRVENLYCDGAKTAVYELTKYEGTGEGYMPFLNGMIRRYDALDLTDGFVGSAEYSYVADEYGDLVIFADRTGIRVLPPPITQYSAIQGEMIEDALWDEGRREESCLRHDVNNFHIICHFLGRPGRYLARPEKFVAWNQYKMRIMEGLGKNGEVPAAWLGYFWLSCFRAACALFGCGRKEEGYEYLEKAIASFKKWDKIKDSEEMEVGDPLIYGGIKVVRKRDVVIKLPDGTIEPVIYEELFNINATIMYNGMTASHGWEWFNPVREEERYKEYVERVRELTARR